MQYLRTSKSKCEEDQQTVIYLLGFSPLSNQQIQQAIADEFPFIHARVVGEVTYWYVEVPRYQFEGPRAEENLADVAWLTPRVVAHQTAVQKLTSLVPFYPAHFGTLFTEAVNVEQLVLKNQCRLLSFFDIAREHEEWGVKLMLDWERAVSAFSTATTNQGAASGNSGGANYLRQQKMLRDRDRQVRQWVQASFDNVQQNLARIAAKTQKLSSNSPTTSNHLECVSNLALLVRREDRDRFQQWYQDWQSTSVAEQGMHVSLTGPWPLYSFCTPLDRSDNIHEAA